MTDKQIMKLSHRGELFIKDWEKLRLLPYQDEIGKWTIGWGSTYYEDGTPVAGTDKKITADRANQLFWYEATGKADAIFNVLEKKGVKVNQNQFDMLLSLTYNIGIGAFMTSTVLKLVARNPNSPFIKDAFSLWNKVTVEGKKKVSAGLTKRRKMEAERYFSTEGLTA